MTCKIIPLGALALASCAHHSTTYLVIGNDETDVFGYGPWSITKDDLEQALALDHSIWGGAVLEVEQISSIRYGQHVSRALDVAGPRLFEDRFARKDHVDRYLTECLELLQDTKPDSGEATSVVFRRTVDIVNRAAATNAERKIAVLFTDYAENDPHLSMYGGGRDLWVNNPDSIRRAWRDQATIGDLTGVEIHLIHDAHNDTLAPGRYEVLGNIAADLYREHHAVVWIGGQFTLH